MAGNSIEPTHRVLAHMRHEIPVLGGRIIASFPRARERLRSRVSPDVALQVAATADCV